MFSLGIFVGLYEVEMLSGSCSLDILLKQTLPLVAYDSSWIELW